MLDSLILIDDFGPGLFILSVQILYCAVLYCTVLYSLYSLLGVSTFSGSGSRSRSLQLGNMVFEDPELFFPGLDLELLIPDVSGIPVVCGRDITKLYSR